MSSALVCDPVSDVNSRPATLPCSGDDDPSSYATRDPLLHSGSYIHPIANDSSDNSPTNKPHSENQSDLPKSEPLDLENGKIVEFPTPMRKKATGTPIESWLPSGWRVEVRVRSSGATAGVADKYYIDPSGRRFRSKLDVQFFLKTGTLRKRRKSLSQIDLESNIGNPGHGKGKKARCRTKTPTRKFDPRNIPDKVKWVLTSAEEDTWTPFIGEDRVPEQDVERWNYTFSLLTNRSSLDNSFNG